MGTAFLQNSQLPQALQSLQQAEKLDPENYLVQNSLGLVYFFRGRFDLAERHFRRAIKIKSNFSDAKNNLGRLLIEKGEYREALVALKEVTEDLTYLTPEKPLINMGIAQFRLKQYPKAKESLLRALAVQRDNCEANTYFGRTLLEQGDNQRAVEALEQAIGFCQLSQFDEPHYYSGLAYFELGESAKAKKRLEEVIQLYPNGKFVERAKILLDSIKR